MGQKLLEYYRYIEQAQGMLARLKLAQETKMPSTRAAFEPDTVENIERFRKAVEKLTGQPPPPSL
ncbi:MAG: hypothetical protein IPK13_22595 [Deltaproteobacteria bacterium]|nr:hypothetical protein [Deltaproteobacteria bacterium]